MLAPIIVLGLGGVGSEIVARLENKVCEKKLSGKVLFATIDTDVNTINRIEQSGFEGCMVQISKNMTVKDYLSKNRENTTWFKETEGLNIKSMTEGAGQVRAISRLAFDMAVRNGNLSELEERINKLFQISEQERYQTPRVLIVSSLAGGTGSGIVLPLAFYIRRFFKEVLHTSSVIIKGMFIMPDVFFDIISSNFEQVSINANAYAAIKELDAFIRKGEGYLPKSYSDKLHLRMPIVGTNKYEEYNGLPYNYCYLFGRKNKLGNSLRSFQAYLDYTVECIYAQAFSPMQELNNSIEDNVFRIASTGMGENSVDGFKRFCSAGTAVLNYPYERIIELLALDKADRTLSEQWSLIDSEYAWECSRNDEARKKGRYVKNRSKGEFYIAYVNAHKDENSFVKKIYDDAMYEQHISELEIMQTESWLEYWKSIETEVDKWLLDQKYLENYYYSVEGTLKFIKKKNYHRKAASFTKLKEQYEMLVGKAKYELERKRGSIFSKFFGRRIETEVLDKSYYLYWLKKEEQFIHPNAIRFFVYNAIELFDAKCEELKKLAENESRELENSQERTSDKVDLSEYYVINQILHRGLMNRITEKVETGLEALKKYQRYILLEQVAEKGKEFFQKLAKEYESFYDVFDYNVLQYKERSKDLKYDLQKVNGTVTRYVCCSDTVLEYMRNATLDIYNDVSIDGEVSGVIFDIIHNNVEKRNKIDNYHEVFQNWLIDYWKNDLKEKYGYLLDLDILDALELEGRGVSQGENKTESYAANRIDKMWDIASPFIGITDGTMELTKNFCTYSELLENRKDYNRIQLLKRLKDSGGIADPEGAIDKYTIVFYQVMYALAPGSLKELAVVRASGEEEFSKGSMSKAYHQMLSNVKVSQITPHIDWDWNRFDILPDFNSEYQGHLESIVYQMFLYQCAMDLDIVIEKNVRKYSLKLNQDTVYKSTLYEMLVKEFIADSSRILIMYEQLNNDIEQCILEGKSKNEYLFYARKNIWGKIVGGMFGVIYSANVDGGINKYDKMLLWKMVYAFIDLLRNVLSRFESEENVKAEIVEIALVQWKKYEEEWNGKANILIQQDMRYALIEKLQHNIFFD